MSRPDVKYTNGSSAIGATVEGLLAIATGNPDYAEGGWYGGVEDIDGYVIGTGTNPIGFNGLMDTTGNPLLSDAPTFWKAAGRTDQDLIDLINQLPGSPNGFTNVNDARAWVNNSSPYSIISTDAGVSESWVLLEQGIGCQPAWDNGAINFINWNDGCGGASYLYDAVNGGNFAIYINGADSAGNDQTSFLGQLIGSTGKITFVQNGNYLTLAFSNDTWSANSYGGSGIGVYFDNSEGGSATPPTIYDYNFDGAYTGFINNSLNPNIPISSLWEVGARAEDLIAITIVVDAAAPSGSVVNSIPGVSSISGTVIQTNLSPFSSGTSYYLGSSGYLALAPSGDFAFRTGDFTIEWFQWEYAHNSHPRIFAIGDYPTADIAVSLEGGFYLMENGGWRVSGANYGTILQTWVHFAVVRISGTTVVYKNGQAISTISDSNDINNTSTELHIGQESPASDAGAYFNGCITNFRITKGLGVYTGNFTVPTGPLSTTASANPFGGSNTVAIPSGYVKTLIQ